MIIRKNAPLRRERSQPRFGLIEDPLHSRLVLVLAVEADHRLRAGKPVEEPAVIPQHVLHAVEVPDFRDASARDIRRRVVPDAGEEFADHRHRQVDVAASVGEGAELGGEVVQSVVEAAPFDGQAFDQEKGVEDSIPLREMEGKRVTAAFLSSRRDFAAIKGAATNPMRLVFFMIN